MLTSRVTAETNTYFEYDKDENTIYVECRLEVHFLTVKKRYKPLYYEILDTAGVCPPSPDFTPDIIRAIAEVTTFERTPNGLTTTPIPPDALIKTRRGSLSNISATQVLCDMINERLLPDFDFADMLPCDKRQRIDRAIRHIIAAVTVKRTHSIKNKGSDPYALYIKGIAEQCEAEVLALQNYLCQSRVARLARELTSTTRAAMPETKRRQEIKTAAAEAEGETSDEADRLIKTAELLRGDGLKLAIALALVSLAREAQTMPDAQLSVAETGIWLDVDRNDKFQIAANRLLETLHLPTSGSDGTHYRDIIRAECMEIADWPAFIIRDNHYERTGPLFVFTVMNRAPSHKQEIWTFTGISYPLMLPINLKKLKGTKYTEGYDAIPIAPYQRLCETVKFDFMRKVGYVVFEIQLRLLGEQARREQNGEASSQITASGDLRELLDRRTDWNRHQETVETIRSAMADDISMTIDPDTLIWTATRLV